MDNTTLQKLVEIADAMHVTVNDFIYVCPYTSYPSYDRELEYLLSTYTLEKQRRITKSIAEIIKTLSE